MTKFTNIGIIQIQEEKATRKENKTMKSKENKVNSTKFKLLKPTIILPLILTMIFIFGLSTNVSADNSFRVENYNRCEELSAELGKEISHFTELDNDPKKQVSSYVANAINSYRTELLSLQSHPDVTERSLESEMLLAYTKGSSAGKLAWIYQYNIYTFTSDDSAAKIREKYESFKASIAGASKYTVLLAESEVMLDELNKLIYMERAKNLALPEDSLTSASLISGSVEKFKNFNCPDIFAEDYAKEYASLVSSLGLQRVRDALKADSEKTFKAIRPSESFSSSYDVSLLVHNLENADSIKKMNDSALDFITALLLIDEKKPYASTLKKEYLELSTTAASRATESDCAASLSGIFNDYSINIKKAETKDTIYALLLGNGATSNDNLISLEKLYNKDNGIVDSCENTDDIDFALINAKADLFKIKHYEILNKELGSLEKTDESLAKNALVEYVSLEALVKKQLITEINIIAEKYNAVLIKKIRDFLTDDALYLDLCAIVENEIKSLSRENIDDFYNKASRLPQKAEALAATLIEYRSILSKEDYTSYQDSEKDELLSILSTLSTSLSSISPSDVAIYSDEIICAQSSAIRALNVVDQTARVRIATRGSQSADILAELASATEKIKQCADKAEMTTQANIAIYKIQRLLTSDAITENCKNLTNSINAMQFLESSEKEAFTTKLSSLTTLAKSAKEAENLTSLEQIWNNFYDALTTIKAEAEAIDLTRAITAYLEKISASSAENLKKLESLQYIAKESSAEIYNKIVELEKKAKADIPALKSSSEVSTYYIEFLKSLDKLSDEANSADLNGYKLFLLKGFDKYEEAKAHYSDENYNKISSIKQAAEEKLKSATTKNECDAIINAALNEALSVNDLLDDEKENALASLLSLLEKLKKESNLYSVESFSKIEGFYDEGKIELGKITDIQKISEVKQTLSKYLTLMKGINKDSIYSSENAHSITTPTLQYPDDYNYSNGLYGSVHLKGGLISDAKLSINLDDDSENSKVEKLLRKAAKKGTLTTYTTLSSETIKLLRSATVARAIDISLSSVAESASGYTLQMLIPNSLRSERVLGLAFLNGDEIEFYPTEQSDSLITTELQHFSKYYIVVESTLNLKPFLIALVILIGTEFLILAGIIYLKKKRESAENNPDDNSNLPTLPTLALIPFTTPLTKIYPENGLTLSVLLSAAAVALGITIALLIRSEAKKSNERKETQEQKLLKGKKDQLLLPEAKYAEEKDNAFFNEENTSELCKVGARKSTEASMHAEIDLDTIAENFKSGETVNLNALKERGLVGENTQSIKILSKGNLTKALIIEANEFSNAAKDALEISGGEAREIKKN